MAKPIAYSNTGPLITEICTEEDLRHNFEQLQNVINIIGNPYEPANPGGDVPQADPNAVAIRIRLTSPFVGSPGEADAVAVLPDGSDGPAIVVRDLLDDYFGSYAVGDEWGFAVPIRIDDVDVYEVRFLAFDPASGGGGGGGSDELVARFNGNPAGYLNNQLVATILDSVAYSASIHQPVYGVVVGNNVRLYTNVSVADGKVAVTAADFAGGFKDYLDVKLKNSGTTPFNASTHTKVYHDRTATGTNGLALESYILHADLPGTVRVASGDTLAYLQDQFTPVVGTPPVNYGLCSVVSNGTVLQVWAPPTTMLSGCGISVSGYTVSVDNVDLAGLGLVPGDGCSLDVAVGCGLGYDGGAIIFDAETVAGGGLFAPDACTLSVGAGCHILVGTDAVAVNVATLAGVTTNTSLVELAATPCSSLQVAIGCGIKRATSLANATVLGALEVDNVPLAGTGLEAGSGCTLNVESSYIEQVIDCDYIMDCVTQPANCQAIASCVYDYLPPLNCDEVASCFDPTYFYPPFENPSYPESPYITPIPAAFCMPPCGDPDPPTIGCSLEIAGATLRLRVWLNAASYAAAAAGQKCQSTVALETDCECAPPP